MFRHLKAEEFTNLMEGSELAADRARHLAGCSQCRSTLASISELHQHISGIHDDTPSIDWTEFRSSVRDGLLSRAVERSSRFRRLTGWALRPAAAWSLALIVVVVGALSATFWHYQTQHSPEEATRFITTVEPALGIVDTVADAIGEDLFSAEETELLEAEVLAWSQTEIFSTLSELETDETDLLRELLASVEDGELDLDEDGMR
jgi:hypothetical protein